ncbi:hypothetical protein [Jiangella mangrovi]|uniref:Uncharacterized protein n=1 Tax=Jiangella mangrovi TaxID=1524084 RepID=A0A7W9LM16_9ACTN|nr:hypothetical protein [Jiangella mangrovi]MBB5788803.1 hypothetical protein [Jiangella mangrovi]
MPPPTKQQVEVKVHEAVARVLASGAVEDDLIECKSAWPDPIQKARQLAGMANRATPDPINWIIGVDEKRQTLTTPSGVEVSDWLAQLEKQFDGGAPALLHHFNVTLASGDQVAVLTFETDRAPYVVKTAGSSIHEVPYRSGTGTRSAKRAELLRMLAPTVDLPATVILSAECSVAMTERTGREPTIDWSGHIELFVEHLSDRTAMMPNHVMSGIVRGAGVDAQLRLKAWSGAWWGTDQPPPDPRPGVSATKDGLLITAPGSGRISLTLQDELGAEAYSDWIAERRLDLEIQLGVTGASRAIHVRTAMRREPIDSTPTVSGSETRVSWLMR